MYCFSIKCKNNYNPERVLKSREEADIHTLLNDLWYWAFDKADSRKLTFALEFVEPKSQVLVTKLQTKRISHL